MWRRFSVNKTFSFKIKLKKEWKITYRHVHKLFANTRAWANVSGLVFSNAKKLRLKSEITDCGLWPFMGRHSVHRYQLFSPQFNVFIFSWINILSNDLFILLYHYWKSSTRTFKQQNCFYLERICFSGTKRRYMGCCSPTFLRRQFIHLFIRD